MMTVILCVVLVIVGVLFLWRAKRPTLSEATKDLFKVAMDKNTTPIMTQTLINLGADVNAKGKDGETALMLAARCDYAEINEIKRLILDYAQ